MDYREYSELVDVPHVVVDGSAQSGTVLTLSHWPGAATPAAVRADLSAEIAFRYLDRSELHVDAPYVTNNHFDQDGLVAVYALTEPVAALDHREQLIDIARAGDFSHFHDRDAARAAIAIAELGSAVDGDPYPSVLAEVPRLLTDIGAYRDLWAAQDEHITLTEGAIADGTITISEEPDLDLAVVRVPATWTERIVQQFMRTERHVAHTYALYNATDRFTVVTVGAGPPELQYRYEGWVEYQSRRPRPRVDLADLATAFTAQETGAGRWQFDGVDSLSPALHLTDADASSISDAEFIAAVRAELSAARRTWSPYTD